MSVPPLRLGLVGCGRLAELGYVPAAAGLSSVDVAAVADPDPARRSVVAGLVASTSDPHAEGGGAPGCYGDARAMLDHEALDGLVLATPAAAHLADATLAAEHGLPVLVEKPPAPDLAGAAALARLDPPPWVALNRRFDPGVRGLRGEVPATGPVELRLRIRYRRRSWGAVAVHDDALADLGPHLVDLARWLTRTEVEEVEAAQVAAQRARVRIRLGRGSATLEAATDRLHDELFEVRDAGGGLVARHRVGGPLGAVGGRLRRGPHPLVASLAAQLGALARAARGSHEPDLGTAADGRAAMATLEAARACAAAGDAVAVVADEAAGGRSS